MVKQADKTAAGLSASGAGVSGTSAGAGAGGVSGADASTDAGGGTSAGAGDVGGRVLGVLAGGMELPPVAVEAARKCYKRVCVVRLMPYCEHSFAGVNQIDSKLAALGRVFAFLRRNGVDDVLLIGTVKRTPLLRLGWDFGALRRIGTISRLLRGGDDHLLSRVVRLIEHEGFRVVGIESILPQLLAPRGVITHCAPDATALGDIELGIRTLRAIAQFDVGQCVVVHDGHVLAIEAAEGTSALLHRVAGLDNRYHRRGGVLVKLAKPRQELRVDRPTIGPATVAAAIEARLSGIAVEAGAVQIVNAQETHRLAQAAGLFMVGVTP